MKKVFSAAFLIAGTVIGAGFASGREIRSFFAVYGAQALWFIPLIFLLLFFGCTAFFLTGKIFEPDSFSAVSKRIFGRGAVFFDFVMIAGNLIFMSGMLAGFDSLGQNIFGMSKTNPSLSIFALVLCAVIVLRGMKGLEKTNNFLVPVIAVFLIAVCLFSINTENLAAGLSMKNDNPGRLLFNSILFVFSNLFTCAGILYTSGKNTAKKSLAAGSLIGAGLLALIMFLFILAALTASPAVFTADMPVFYLSQTLGGFFGKMASAILIAAIFTTLLSNMYNIFDWAAARTKNKYVVLTVICALAFTIRSLGFNIIVDYLYVYIGAFGAVYSVANIVYLLLYLKNKNKISVHI